MIRVEAAEAHLIDLPAGTFRRVRIDARHDAGADAEAAIAKALAPLAGQGRVVHFALVRRGMAWEKTRWRLLVVAGRSVLSVRSPQLRSSQVKQVLEHLAEVPGLRDVRVRATS